MLPQPANVSYAVDSNALTNLKAMLPDAVDLPRPAPAAARIAKRVTLRSRAVEERWRSIGAPENADENPCSLGSQNHNNSSSESNNDVGELLVVERSRR
jgi:hypothetical protein